MHSNTPRLVSFVSGKTKRVENKDGKGRKVGADYPSSIQCHCGLSSERISTIMSHRPSTCSQCRLRKKPLLVSSSRWRPEYIHLSAAPQEKVGRWVDGKTAERKWMVVQSGNGLQQCRCGSGVEVAERRAGWLVDDRRENLILLEIASASQEYCARALKQNSIDGKYGKNKEALWRGCGKKKYGATVTLRFLVSIQCRMRQHKIATSARHASKRAT
ncbi:hypothetical protein K438DRAFT_2058531 [Mycena galopus ATCC 62051]|nr:hypothetical protein K438DRAFT_2058531 [Mycena galopus ATCC 62051]